MRAGPNAVSRKTDAELDCLFVGIVFPLFPSGPHLTTPLISFDYLMQFNGFLPFQCEWPFNDESKDIQDVMGKVADSEPVQPPIRSLV